MARRPFINTIRILVMVLPCGCQSESKSGSNIGNSPARMIASRHDAPKSPPDFQVRFTDMGRASGLTMSFQDGQEAGHLAIVESLGGGVGLRDFDLDGHTDIFLPGGGRFLEDRTLVGNPSGLFRNLGHWEFENVAAAASCDQAPHYSHGAAIGDYNEDGFADILVTGYGGLLLYENLGDGTFLERAMAGGLSDRLWSSSAAWGDLNGDGWLDLYVAHYVNWSFENHPKCKGPNGEFDVCPPRQFEGLPDTVYFNLGDSTFRDGSREAGLRSEGKGLGVILADLDTDGDLDVYVGNDTVANFLYRNDGIGHLEEVGELSGTAFNDRGIPDGSMGVEVSDCNLDGKPDIWVANYEQESIAYYRNDGQFLFSHDSRRIGVAFMSSLSVGWGTCFLDADRDGDEDCFISNGHVIRFPTASTILQVPQLLLNQEGKKFENVAPFAGDYMKSQHNGRGAGIADLDHDGLTDLVVSRVNAPVVALKNESHTANHGITLRLIGRKGNRDAIGSQIRVVSSLGERLYLTKGGGSFASSNDLPIIIGLGTAQVADKIEIKWPSGSVGVLRDVSPNGQVTLFEPLD